MTITKEQIQAALSKKFELLNADVSLPDKSIQEFEDMFLILEAALEPILEEYERLKYREQLAHELLGDAVRLYTGVGNGEHAHELTLDIQKLWFNSTDHNADNLEMVDHIVDDNEKVMK